MVYGGARGETADQVAKVARFPLPQHQFHPAFGALNSKLLPSGSQKSGPLLAANALWGQTGLPFDQAFLQLLRDHYQSDLHEVDFIGGFDKAREVINAWVEKKTNEKVTDLLPTGAVTEKTRLVLANAVYFKADWLMPFDKKHTKDVLFHLSAQEKASVPMMQQFPIARYYADSSAQILELPYSGKQWAFVVVLPKQVGGLPGLEKSLNSKWLEDRVSKLQEHLVELTLPRFRVKSGFSLGKRLAEMGMPLAFSPGADFSGITKEAVLLQDLVHKTVLEVDEKGTEAAAATGVVQGLPHVAAGPLPKAVFRADHPFLFVVRENSSGTILFLGRLSDPRAD
jgi:serpin B